MPDLDKLVIKRFPDTRNMQLVCLRVPGKFQCSRCHKMKMAKLLAVVAGDWDHLLCKSCYAKVLSEPSPVAEAPMESRDDDEEKAEG
jgi:hypothetical protein